jgi:hypothetical protein
MDPVLCRWGLGGFRSAVVFEVSTGPEQLRDLMFGCEAERLCSGWRFCWHRIHTGAWFCVDFRSLGGFEVNVFLCARR